MLQDEICPQCGHPIWLCRSSSNVIHFKPKQATCYATKALEAAKDRAKPVKERAKGDAKKDWGKFWYTEVDVLPIEKEAGTKLPTRREYYESQINP